MRGREARGQLDEDRFEQDGAGHGSKTGRRVARRGGVRGGVGGLRCGGVRLGQDRDQDATTRIRIDDDDQVCHRNVGRRPSAGPRPRARRRRRARGTGGPRHVMVVMMENKSFSQVIGQADQPFTNSLAVGYGLATQELRLRPSQPPELPGHRVGLEPGSHRRQPAVVAQLPRHADPGRPARRGGVLGQGIRREPPCRPHHQRRGVRRAPCPVGVLPQDEDRRRRRLVAGLATSTGPGPRTSCGTPRT